MFNISSWAWLRMAAGKCDLDDYWFDYVVYIEWFGFFQIVQTSSDFSWMISLHVNTVCQLILWCTNIFELNVHVGMSISPTTKFLLMWVRAHMCITRYNISHTIHVLLQNVQTRVTSIISHWLSSPPEMVPITCISRNLEWCDIAQFHIHLCSNGAERSWVCSVLRSSKTSVLVFSRADGYLAFSAKFTPAVVVELYFNTAPRIPFYATIITCKRRRGSGARPQGSWMSEVEVRLERTCGYSLIAKRKKWN